MKKNIATNQTAGSLTRTAVVTGANGAMGTVLCEGLLEAGYRVVALCLGRTVTPEFVARFEGLPLEIRACDLSDLREVKAVAAQLVAEGVPVDLLLNNAGILGWKPQVTAQGYEMHYVVNCLAPIYLTQCLEPLLHSGSRVVNTISCAMWVGRIPACFPYPPKRFHRVARYATSKRLNLMYMRELAVRWAAKGITLNGVDPGIVNTPLISMHNAVDFFSKWLFRPFIRTPYQGAQTALYLALSPQVEGLTGKLFFNHRAVRLPRWIRSGKTPPFDSFFVDL